MKKFGQMMYEPLIWKHDGVLRRSYTLYHEHMPLVRLKQDQGLFKMDASIYPMNSDEPLFVFRPKGIMNPRIEVESSDFDFEPAKVTPRRWGGGVDIAFLNGNRYEWSKQSFWGYKWLLTTADGIKIAKLEVKGWNNRGVMTILTDDIAPAELNLLMFAGWCQMLFELQTAAAA